MNEGAAEILKRCKKKVSSEKNDEEDEHISETRRNEEETETAEILDAELPFEDILAEKRRKYTAKDEFIYLLYNDLLRHFVNAWDGELLRKTHLLKTESANELSSQHDEECDELSTNQNKEWEENLIENVEQNNELDQRSPWKVIFRDERVDMSFVNNNVFVGRVSRKMMEGDGLYKWNDGVQYKGQFQANQIQGSGLLEWKNNCFYEGKFKDGYRHGKGVMVDRDNNNCYIGEWYMGQRNGKGFCRYTDNSTYDGDWNMGKKDGVGLRIYSTGARYIGHWKNDLRHGTGTIAWPHGDVYRGEWECGQMHGQGEYIWSAFLNKTLSWPQENCYVGEWDRGLRHGKGVQKFNAIGGAKYSGCWKRNKKHGYGIIIGNNGSVTEGDPLFLKDVLVPLKVTDTRTSEIGGEVDSVEGSVEDLRKKKSSTLLKEGKKITEARALSIAQPDQCPPLWYHIHRLLEPHLLREPSFCSLTLSGKCHVCEKNSSCACLIELAKGSKNSQSQKSVETDSIVITNEITSKLSTNSSFSTHSITDTNITIIYEFEERCVYDCLAMHMPRLRHIYDTYCKLFTKSPPNCNLVMSKLSLWQLWRDCGLHKRGYSLIEIDDYVAKNKSVFIEDPYCPFEKIETWQFLHALLEVSWHMYTKDNDVESTETYGTLASGLNKLLNVDVFPHAGNHIGVLVNENTDLLPIYAVYQLYRKLDYPPSARQLLQAALAPQASRLPAKRTTVPVPEYLMDGINCVTIGEKLSYLPKQTAPLTQSQTVFGPTDHDSIDTDLEISVLSELGAKALMEVISEVCPLVKDIDDNIIIGTEYKLTFLEFYEFLLKATKRLLCARKVKPNEIKSARSDTASNHTLKFTNRSSTLKVSEGRKKRRK